MKKIILVLTLIASSVIACNAQWFIGGSIGVSHSSGEDKNFDGIEWTDTKRPDSFGMSFNPRVGYMFNDWLSAGLGLGYSYSRLKGETNKVYFNSYHIAPFFRAVCLHKGRFALTLETTVGATFGDGKMKYDDVDIANVKMSSKNIGVSVVPILQFKLSPKVILESQLNFLSLNYSYVNQKQEHEEENGRIIKTKSNNFRFGYDGDNLFTTGELTVGFIYKF